MQTRKPICEPPSDEVASLRAQVASLTEQLTAYAEEARQRQDLQRAFRETRDHLLTAPDEVNLLRQAVDLGHRRLGFERLSIWLCSDDPGIVTGSYGIDEQGVPRDERAARVEVHPLSLMGRVLSGEAHVLIEEDDTLFDETAAVIGHGAHAIAALWDGQRIVGCLSVDTYLSRLPFSAAQVDILSHYAALLGRLLTEQRLKASQLDLMHLLRLLLDNTPHPVFVRDAAGRVVLGNRALAETYRLPVDALPGKTQAELFQLLGLPQAYTDSALAEDRQVLATGLPSVRVKAFPDHDGALHWYRTLRCKVALRDGTPCVLVMSEEITEVKQVSEALKASEARYRRIVETAQEGICMLDPTGYFTYLNTRMAMMLGYAVEDLVGQHAFDYFDLETMDEILLLFGKRLEGHTATRDIRLRRKDGSDLWTSIALTPVTDELGQLVGILAMAADITGRKAAEVALARERAFLAAGMDIMPLMLFALAPNRTFLYANQPMYDFNERHGIRGVASVTLMDGVTGEPIPYDDWPEARALRGETVPLARYIMRLPSGEEMTLMGAAAPVVVNGMVIAAAVVMQEM